MENEQLITVREASRRLSVATHTLYRWIKAGRLSVIKLGNKTIRIRQSTIEAMINNKPQGTVPIEDTNPNI